MPRSRHRGRSSRKGPGRAGKGAPVVSIEGERLFRSAIAALAQVAGKGDPLLVELMVSDLLGTALAATDPCDPDEDRVVEELAGLLARRAARERTPEALVLLRALAAAGPRKAAAGAREAARVLAASGVVPPPGMDGIGGAAFEGAWRVTHPFGDQDAVLVAFRHPGRPPHLVSVLVDRNLGGIAKDIGVTDRPAEVLEAWRRHPEFAVEPIDVAEAAGRIRAAVGVWRLYHEPPAGDDVPARIPFVLGRLRGVPDTWRPQPERGWSEEEREELVEAFLASPEARRSRQAPDVLQEVAEAGVDYLCDEGAGDPLRWNPVAVELFLLDWCPRKLAARDEVVEGFPAALRALVRFTGRRAGLAAHLIAETTRAVDRFRWEFAEAMRDPRRFGPAKAMILAMLAEGVDVGDPEAVQRWVDDFNARPFEERARLLPVP